MSGDALPPCLERGLSFDADSSMFDCEGFFTIFFTGVEEGCTRVFFDEVNACFAGVFLVDDTFLGVLSEEFD